MSEQKVPRSVEQRIVIKFLVGENVPSAEIHHRLQQQYGEECLRRNTNVNWGSIIEKLKRGKRRHYWAVGTFKYVAYMNMKFLIFL